MTAEELLKNLGIQDINKGLLDSYKALARFQILERINLKEIPTKYEPIVSFKAVGFYLNYLNSSGKLNISGSNFEEDKIASITQGDISISFKNDISQEQKQQDLIDVFINYGNDLLKAWIVWE